MLDSVEYISYGIILPVIMLFGLPGNIIALCILHHRYLRGSPVCLLKVLAVHGILTMCFSIYAEVVPTIQMYLMYNSNSFMRNNWTKMSKLSETLNVTNRSGNETNAHTERSDLAMTRLSYFEILSTDLNNNSFNYDIFEMNIYQDVELEAKNMIKQAIQSFISYNLIHIGLLVTLLLTIERCVAVFFPLKAMRWLTNSRKRIVTFIFLLLCIIVHLPQLSKEITLAKCCPAQNITEFFKRKSVVDPVRKESKIFFAYSSFALCVVTFILDIILLVKLCVIKRALRGSKHLRHAEGHEMNISVAIAILVFFQLPFHVLSTVINELKYKFVSDNINHMTRLVAISRVLYIGHAALNFVIYCLMAKNCRHVLSLVFKRITRTSISISQRHEHSAHVSSFRRQLESVPLTEQSRINPSSIASLYLKAKSTEIVLYKMPRECERYSV